MSENFPNVPIFKPAERYPFVPGDRIGFHVSGTGRIGYFLPATVVANDLTTALLIVRYDDMSNIAGRDDPYGSFDPTCDQVLPWSDDLPTADNPYTY